MPSIGSISTAHLSSKGKEMITGLFPEQGLGVVRKPFAEECRLESDENKDSSALCRGGRDKGNGKTFLLGIGGGVIARRHTRMMVVVAITMTMTMTIKLVAEVMMATVTIMITTMMVMMLMITKEQITEQTTLFFFTHR